MLALEFLDPIDPVTIPSTLNTFLTTLRYNSYYFYSIIVDTRVAK